VKATVVVHLQGGPEQALRCFESLAILPPEPEHEVIVVDDASTGLGDLLARLGGDVHVISLERREGFAASVSRAAREAGGEVLVMLRGAPEVSHGWLAPLVTAVTSGGHVAAASVTAGEPGAHLVAAHAIAVPTDKLTAIGGVPDAPEELAVAALCTALASAGGKVAAVPASTLVAPGRRMGTARRAPGDDPELTRVIPTLDAASERVRACVSAIQRATEGPYEIVLVDNGAPPQGFTAPVNSGLRAARGRYAVVMNDDVEVLPGWWPPLREALEAGASVTFPVTVDGAMRTDFAAWCFAVSRESLERFESEPGEFFDPRFRIWYQDTDLLARLRAAGAPPLCVDGSRIRHGLSETVASDDPELREWIAREIARDREAFLEKHPQVQLSSVAIG
jgi:GT2 family glycosyltransferase